MSEVTLKKIKHKGNVWFGVVPFCFRLAKNLASKRNILFLLSADNYFCLLRRSKALYEQIELRAHEPRKVYSIPSNAYNFTSSK